MKLRHRSLGVKLASSAIGWSMVEEAGSLPKHREIGDPLTLALAAVPVGEHVDLIVYGDPDSFAQSQAARDGLTREAHIAMMLDLQAKLIVEGRSASLKWVTVEP